MGGTHTHAHTWAAALPCRADVWDDMMKKDVHYIILLFLQKRGELYDDDDDERIRQHKAEEEEVHVWR